MGDELAQADESLYRDAAWQPGFDELWQCDAITEFVVLPQDVRRLVALETSNAERIGAGRVALVITREVVQMIGELYQHLVADANREVGIFVTLEEAAAWLGLAAPPSWFAEQTHAAQSAHVSAGSGRHGW